MLVVGTDPAIMSADSQVFCPIPSSTRMSSKIVFDDSWAESVASLYATILTVLASIPGAGSGITSSNGSEQSLDTGELSPMRISRLCSLVKSMRSGVAVVGAGGSVRMAASGAGGGEARPALGVRLFL